MVVPDTNLLQRRGEFVPVRDGFPRQFPFDCSNGSFDPPILPVKPGWMCCWRMPNAHSPSLKSRDTKTASLSVRKHVGRPYCFTASISARKSVSDDLSDSRCNRRQPRLG